MMIQLPIERAAEIVRGQPNTPEGQQNKIDLYEMFYDIYHPIKAGDGEQPTDEVIERSARWGLMFGRMCGFQIAIQDAN